MSHRGQYANGDTYPLPADWSPLDESVLKNALEYARAALTDDAMRRLQSFYDPRGEYAGTSFLTAQPNLPGSVTAADLYAVSRLSITVTNLQGRLLLENVDCVAKTQKLLAAIPDDLTIINLTPAGLTAMWDLYHHFRTLLATETRDSNYWVFAAKLCARKRPASFPVRDSVVCGYLSGGQRLASSADQARQGRLGWFSSDIQVFAYVATDAEGMNLLHTLKHA